MTELTQSERLDAARRKFQELKKRNEGLFKVSRVSPSSPPLTDANAPDVTELTSTIEQQKATIKKLRDENTGLKLERMDLADRVAELEQELTQLKTKLPAAQHTVPQSPRKSETFDDPQALTNSADIRDHIMSWKDWQVDMRDWNGSRYTQIVL